MWTTNILLIKNNSCWICYILNCCQAKILIYTTNYNIYILLNYKYYYLYNAFSSSTETRAALMWESLPTVCISQSIRAATECHCSPLKGVTKHPEKCFFFLLEEWLCVKRDFFNPPSCKRRINTQKHSNFMYFVHGLMTRRKTSRRISHKVRNSRKPRQVILVFCWVFGRFKEWKETLQATAGRACRLSP